MLHLKDFDGGKVTSAEKLHPGNFWTLFVKILLYLITSLKWGLARNPVRPTAQPQATAKGCWCGSTATSGSLPILSTLSQHHFSAVDAILRQRSSTLLLVEWTLWPWLWTSGTTQAEIRKIKHYHVQTRVTKHSRLPPKWSSFRLDTTVSAGALPTQREKQRSAGVFAISAPRSAHPSAHCPAKMAVAALPSALPPGRVREEGAEENWRPRGSPCFGGGGAHTWALGPPGSFRALAVSPCRIGWFVNLHLSSGSRCQSFGSFHVAGTRSVSCAGWNSRSGLASQALGGLRRYGWEALRLRRAGSAGGKVGGGEGGGGRRGPRWMEEPDSWGERGGGSEEMAVAAAAQWDAACSGAQRRAGSVRAGRRWRPGAPAARPGICVAEPALRPPRWVGWRRPLPPRLSPPGPGELRLASVPAAVPVPTGPRPSRGWARSPAVGLGSSRRREGRARLCLLWARGEGPVWAAGIGARLAVPTGSGRGAERGESSRCWEPTAKDGVGNSQLFAVLRPVPVQASEVAEWLRHTWCFVKERKVKRHVSTPRC